VATEFDSVLKKLSSAASPVNKTNQCKSTAEDDEEGGEAVDDAPSCLTCLLQLI
jgi:hypothetical protein